jgi:hypothetical protein
MLEILILKLETYPIYPLIMIPFELFVYGILFLAFLVECGVPIPEWLLFYLKDFLFFYFKFFFLFNLC